MSSTTQLPSSIFTHLRCASSASACARPSRAGGPVSNIVRKHELCSAAITHLCRRHPKEVFSHGLVRHQPAMSRSRTPTQSIRHQRRAAPPHFQCANVERRRTAHHIAASWLVKTSHSPSEATITQRSSGWITTRLMSGVPTTPTDSASPSPMDLGESREGERYCGGRSGVARVLCLSIIGERERRKKRKRRAWTWPVLGSPSPFGTPGTARRTPPARTAAAPPCPRSLLSSPSPA